MSCSCEYQNEIQNLFMAATYNANGKEESFLIVTNSPDKGKNSVCTFILKLIDESLLKIKKN